MSKKGQKKSNHRAETFYFPRWACQLTLSGAGNPQWAHQQTVSCRGGVLEESRAGIQSPPHSWKRQAVVQGQWEPVCRHLHASETAAGQTETPSTSSWWDSVSSLPDCCMSVSLQMPLLLILILQSLCNLCWLCSVFGDVEGAGKKKEAAKTFPSPKIPCLQLVLLLICFGAWFFVFGQADYLFLCSREWKVGAGLRIRLTV